MRNQRGITLIALVITIIVLLILAGVSIAMLTGDNGILTQANNSKYTTSRAEAVEKINLTLNAVKTEVYAQRVDEANWDPLSSGAMKKEITDILNSDEVKSTDTESEIYYTFQDGILTLNYYSNAKANLASTDAITGNIDLNASADTFLDLSPASLPAD